jgi:hypothetical protein
MQRHSQTMNTRGFILAGLLACCALQSRALTITTADLTAGEDINLHVNIRQEGAGLAVFVDLRRFERGSIASLFIDGTKVGAENFDPQLTFYAEVDLNSGSALASVFAPGEHVLRAYLNNPDTAFQFFFTIESFDPALPTVIPRENVPDGGATAGLLALAFGGLMLARSRH